MLRNKPGRDAAALQWRRTKIIATLGPASNSPAMIAELIAAGVNLFRINMSHGDQASHLLGVIMRIGFGRQGDGFAEIAQFRVDGMGRGVRLGRLIGPDSHQADTGMRLQVLGEIRRERLRLVIQLRGAGSTHRKAQALGHGADQRGNFA